MGGKGMGKGKGGPPPPNRLGPPPPKGKASSKASPLSKGVDDGVVLPLGRKLHWKPIADRNLENTVWAEINDAKASPRQPTMEAPELVRAKSGRLPVEVLERLFKNAGPVPAGAKSAPGTRRKTTFQEQVTILDTRRAQNVGIILAGLGFPSSELNERLQTLNVQGLDLESLEKCKDVIPTEEEVERMSTFRGDPSTLRDVEQRLYPLCLLTRLPQRLNIMNFAVELQQVSADLKKEIETMTTAAEQVKTSRQLRTILRVVLTLGNFVNHGTTESLATKGFSVEALPKLIEMKSAIHPSVTMLHFVAYRVLGATTEPGCKVGQVPGDPCPLRTLRDELNSVGAASRIMSNLIQKQLEAMEQKTKMVASEMKFASKYEPEAIDSLKRIQGQGEVWMDELTVKFNECERQLLDLLHFFGEDPKQRSVSALFATLQEFVDAFSRAVADIRRSPKKFHMLLYAGNKEEPKPSRRNTTFQMDLPNDLLAKVESQSKTDAGLPRRTLPNRTELLDEGKGLNLIADTVKPNTQKLHRRNTVAFGHSDMFGEDSALLSSGGGPPS